MSNHHQEDKISLPAKILLETLPGGVGRPPLAASGHRLHLGCNLVGPDVKWSVSGLVWSGLWASFACVTQDAIVCDFIYVFFVFSSYSGLVLLKSIILQNNYGARLVIQICELEAWFFFSCEYS